MIKCNVPKVEYSTEITFTGISETDYFATISKLDEEIRTEMRKNEMCEIKSNEFAREFVTTVNFN